MTEASTYDHLLSEARNEVKKFREAAIRLIPKMYNALRHEERLSISDARDRIEKDCIEFWDKRTIIDALPSECKQPIKREAGRGRGKTKREILVYKDSAAGSAAESISSTSEGEDEDDVPEGKILVDKDDYELLRKRATMLNSEASQANVELVQTRDQLMQARMLIDGLHETIKKLRAGKDQEKQGKDTQTTLDKFIPAFKKIVETAHSEKCPAGCRTWHAAHRIALPAQ